MQGVEKASLGTRYLINYIDDRNPVKLDVVKNCIRELNFWAVLMHFCNNMDFLFSTIPDRVLEYIFEEKPLGLIKDVIANDVEELVSYGKGYKSNFQGDYRKQLRLVRNALAHGNFTFDGDVICIDNPLNNFVAVFDYKWFEVLTRFALANANNTLKEGTEDYILFMLLIDASLYKSSDINRLVDEGLINCIHLTCCKQCKEVLVRKFPNLRDKVDQITFDQMKLIFLRVLTKTYREKCLAMSPRAAFNVALNNLKKVYKGIFDIELVELPDIRDEEFLNLNLKEGTDYMVNVLSYKNRCIKNTIDLKRMLEILKKIDCNDTLSAGEMYALKDITDYLLCLYGYIYFSSSNNHKGMQEVTDGFMECMDLKFIHAKKIWSEYIKRINNGITALKNGNASEHRIELWVQRLNIYQRRLEKAMCNTFDGQIYNNFRNALTHGLVLRMDNDLVFYGEEPTIKIPKINSKSKELEEYSFHRPGHTFEISIDKDKYLEMVDILYEISGIEIKVNIAKYRKRKDYLKS